MKERWSITYLNKVTDKYETAYYYDLESFVTARDKAENDDTKSGVRTNYLKYE